MSVKSITTDDLRRMKGSEGLILQGCGGDLNEWVDGINDLLTKEGILQNGTRFEECSSFQHDGLTCLLFPFGENTDINVGRLAMWLANARQFRRHMAVRLCAEQSRWLRGRCC